MLMDGDTSTIIGGDANAQHDEIVAVRLSGTCDTSSFRVYGRDRDEPDTDLRHIRVAYSTDGSSWTCYTQSDDATQGGTPGMSDASTMCNEGPSHAASGNEFNVDAPASYVEFAFWGRTDIYEIELTSCTVGGSDTAAPPPPNTDLLGAGTYGAANCIAETCHNDGHWVEVAFPEASDCAGDMSIDCCTSQCLLHPEATALQYNDDGWCGCMTMGDDVAFDEAINSGQHLGPWTACTICDLSSMCFYETCHNDGHWVEVDFPDTGGQTGTAGLASCRDQCISHSEATAFQFNDDGWCGCMVLDGDISFADAVGGEQHLGPWTECTICDISNSANPAVGGGGGNTYEVTTGYCRGGPTWGGDNPDPINSAYDNTLWDCSPSEVPGEPFVTLSMDECQAICDDTENCGAYDMESHALGGETLTECCLFLPGHTGQGSEERTCMVKAGVDAPGPPPTCKLLCMNPVSLHSHSAVQSPAVLEYSWCT
jgi:hypothetical protein